jgi:Leucine-rich repeat (LRR) protein
MLNELSFIGQSGLEVLDLSSNELEHISSNAFTHVPRLKWLSLANNELNIPDNTPFLQNMNLQFLHLENCSLNRIVLSSFFGIVNLKELYLTSNKPRTVEMGSITLFRSLANIRFVELSHNNLEDVPHALTQLPSLEDVNIRYNELRNLSDILLMERHVRRLNISNNPWGCLCEACDLDTICGSITYQIDLCGSWNESESVVHCVSEDIVAIVSEPLIGVMVAFTAEYVFVQGWFLVCCAPL